MNFERKWQNRVVDTRKTYDAWKSMWRRCNCEDDIGWPNYGGRGISVDPRWSSYDNFVADMGLCPDEKMLDRIDNDGNYSPSNCRWTNRTVQNNNRRNVRHYMVEGARHGTIGGYTNSRCRCEQCKAAKREYTKKSAAK